MATLTNIEKAKILNSLRKDAIAKTNDCKSLNWRNVIKTLQLIGIEVSVEDFQTTIETGKTTAGNPFKRTIKNGLQVSFTLNGNKFISETTSTGFSYGLTCFMSTLNVLETIKSL